MIEAYEIGIKLALQDGVSEGVAAIRRDLGSLDLAIAQTTLRLGQLQRIGAQVLAASQEQPDRVVSGVPARRPASVVTPPPLPEPEPAAAATEVQTVMPMQTSPARPPASAPAVLTAPPAAAADPGPLSPTVVVRPEIAGPAVATRPSVVVVDAVGAPSSPRPLEQPTAARPAGAAPPLPSPAAAMVARLVVPSSHAGDPFAQRSERAWESASPRSVGRVPSALEAASLAPQQVPAEPGRPERTRQAVHRHGDVREVHARQPAAASDLPVARMTSVPDRPAAIFSPPPSMAPPAPASYAPPAASPRGREASMRGDVFFDGTRVGRWMSEQMARDAGRPNAGPTGFDPRRSPAWPGAAVTW